MANKMNTLMVTDYSLLSASSEQSACDLEGEVVILSLKNGAYYGLNPVGSRIWEMIQKPTSMNHIRATLLDEYDVEPERCNSDLMQIIQELASEGLIEINNESPA